MISNINQLLLIGIIVFGISTTGMAGKYVSSDDILNGNNSIDSLFNDEQSERQTTDKVKKNGTTIALSDYVEIFQEIPDSFVKKLVLCIKNELASSLFFELVELNTIIQKELDEEVLRVANHDISGENRVILGKVSGVQYFLKISIVDFSVIKKKSMGGNLSNKYGELSVRVGIELIDTSTRKLAVGKQVFKRSVFEVTDTSDIDLYNKSALSNNIYTEKGRVTIRISNGFVKSICSNMKKHLSGSTINDNGFCVSPILRDEMSKFGEKVSHSVIVLLAKSLTKIMIVDILSNEMVVINGGSKVGVKVGDTFELVSSVDSIESLNEANSGVVVEIEKVMNDESVGRVLPTEKHMQVEPNMLLRKVKKELVNPFNSSVDGIKM